jgi:peptidase E
MRHIVACGGRELWYPQLIDHVLSFARRERPKVLFLPTASGDGEFYIRLFRMAFGGRACDLDVLQLFARTVDDVDSLVRDQDVVIVGGGKGSACPHYDSEARRPMVYAREIAAGLAPGIALDDGVAARYEDERLVEVVSGRPDGRAFQVDRDGEHPLAVRVL